MKKTIHLLALAGTIMAAQTVSGKGIADSSFRIQGYLPDQKTGKVYLDYTKNKERVHDSALLKEGRFEFKGFISHPAKASVYHTPQGQQFGSSKNFYLEPGNVQITAFRSISDAVVQGGETQGAYELLTKLQAALTDQQNHYFSRRYLSQENADSAYIYTMALRKIGAEQRKTELDFIKKFPDSYVSWGIIQDAAFVIDADVLEPELQAIGASFRNSAEGKEMAEKLVLAKKTGIGAPALEFSQTDANGREVSLSSFRGKYVLIDFWASWCGPCRLENPHVLKAYDAFKDKGFTVLGVSLDGDKAKWLKAVEQDKMPWLQVSDLTGWKNAAAQQYGIKAIPQNFLIDPKGVIVARNLRGADLMVTLQEIIDGKKEK